MVKKIIIAISIIIIIIIGIVGSIMMLNKNEEASNMTNSININDTNMVEEKIENEIEIPTEINTTQENNQVEKVEDEVFVKVAHPMEKEHYIEWIAQVVDNKEEFVYLYPEGPAEVRFKDIPNATIYAYCNKHGLWKKEM